MRLHSDCQTSLDIAFSVKTSPLQWDVMKGTSPCCSQPSPAFISALPIQPCPLGEEPDTQKWDITEWWAWVVAWGHRLGDGKWVEESDP